MSQRAFPTHEHEWGVQNAYVQAAADLGVIGIVLWLLPFLLALVLALRANAPPGAVAIFAILGAMGVWVGQGLVAGIPLDAVTWLGFGLAATAAAQRTSATHRGTARGADSRIGGSASDPSEMTSRNA